LIQPCPLLPMPEGETWASLIANHDAVTAQYHRCRMMQRYLMQAARQQQQTMQRQYCTAMRRAKFSTQECPDE